VHSLALTGAAAAVVSPPKLSRRSDVGPFGTRVIMASSSARQIYRGFAGAMMAAVVIAATPAHSQGLFESLFGGMRRAAPPPETMRSYADPQSEREAPARTARGGAYCVRTCDGHYFPVQAHGPASAAEMCKSFCPAAETRIYSGNSIDRAVASDGTPYIDMPKAYSYRQKLTEGCSCNGRSAFGLARIDPATDPTLRKGDVVATKEGLAVYNAGKGDSEFTPVENSRSLSKSTRERLSNTPIMSPGRGAPSVASVAAD
jgi:hypothetical protein